MSYFVGTPYNFITIFLSFQTYKLNIQEYNHKMIGISSYSRKCAMSSHLFCTKCVSLGQLTDEI